MTPTPSSTCRPCSHASTSAEVADTPAAHPPNTSRFTSRRFSTSPLTTRTCGGALAVHGCERGGPPWPEQQGCDGVRHGGHDLCGLGDFHAAGRRDVERSGSGAAGDLGSMSCGAQRRFRDTDNRDAVAGRAGPGDAGGVRDDAGPRGAAAGPSMTPDTRRSSSTSRWTTRPATRSSTSRIPAPSILRRSTSSTSSSWAPTRPRPPRPEQLWSCR